LFSFSTKALNICNSCMSVTPKVGVHLGIIGLHLLHSPSFVRVCFTPKHSQPHGCLHFTLCHKSNVKVATLNKLGKKVKKLKHWRKHSPNSWIFHENGDKTYKNLQEIGGKSGQTKIWKNVESISIIKMSLLIPKKMDLRYSIVD